MNRAPSTPIASLAAACVLLVPCPAFPNTGPGAEGHALVVLNGSGDGTYRAGERVSLAASPPTGYSFVR